jgi:hypothetical protein
VRCDADQRDAKRFFGQLEVMRDHLARDHAVLATLEPLGEGLAFVARQEVKRHPHLSLVARLEVLGVGRVVGGGLDVDPTPVAQLDAGLRDVVVDELCTRRDRLGNVGPQTGRPSEGIGGVVVRVDLHGGRSSWGAQLSIHATIIA